MRPAFIAFFLAGLIASAVSKAVVQSLTFTTVQSFGNTSNSRIAVPFGTLDGVKFSEPSLVQTAESNFDINEVVSDEEWERYRAKGAWYKCLLDMTVEKAGKAMGDTRVPPSAESVWQSDFSSDIRNWGWVEAPLLDDTNCDFRDDMSVHMNNKIGTALTTLKISLTSRRQGGDNECYSVEHGNDDLLEDDMETPLENVVYEHNGKEWPLTGGHYRFAMNKNGGAIFAEDLLSPKAAAERNLEEDYTEDDLPQLSRASDILYSYWFRKNPGVNKLRYYFANHVRNDETLPLVSQILKNRKMSKVPYWPSVELSINTVEAQAILAALGVKNIQSVTIFRENFPEDGPGGQTPEVQLLFKIVDVPLDVVDSSPDMQEKPGTMKCRAVQLLDDGGKNVVREHRTVVRL